MAVICGSCKFCKERTANSEVVLKDASTGKVLQIKGEETKRVLVCDPPATVTGYPYRNQVVNCFGTCSMGEG